MRTDGSSDKFFLVHGAIKFDTFETGFSKNSYFASGVLERVQIVVI